MIVSILFAIGILLGCCVISAALYYILGCVLLKKKFFSKESLEILGIKSKNNGKSK